MRAHVILPDELLAEVDSMVGSRGRSQFIAEAVRKEVKRLRMLKALDEAAGAWQDKNHPELAGGSAAWVEELRKNEEQRQQRRKK